MNPPNQPTLPARQHPPGFSRRFLLAAGLGALAAPAAQAQGIYPTRPVTIIVPYPAGGASDIGARLLATELAKALGQPVVIDNVGGAGGAVGVQKLLRAPADGYTLLYGALSETVLVPLINPAANYRLEDMAAIAFAGATPAAFVTRPDFPASTMDELLALARKSPGAIDVAVAGTSTGLVGELFAIQNGLRFHNVPYKGAAPAMLAVLKDEAKLVFLDAGNLAPHITAGKMTGLLITGDQRWPVLQNVPTAREAGQPQFDVSTWFGLFARAEVPSDVQDRLNAAVRKVMASPRMEDFLRQRGAVPSSLSTAEFRAFFHREVDTWAEVIRKADIKAE